MRHHLRDQALVFPTPSSYWPLVFHLGELVPEHGAEISEGGFHFFAVDDTVKHSDAIDEFGGLEVVGDFENLGLGANPCSGKADESFWFGEDDIGDGGVAGEDSGHSGIGEDGNVGDAVLPAFIDGGGGFCHLHEAQEAFLHAGATGGAEDDDGALEFDSAFKGAGDFFAVDRSH